MKKTKQIRIRISETQFKKLADLLVQEQWTKSKLIREMIEQYTTNCRKIKKINVIQKIKEIKDIDINTRK